MQRFPLSAFRFEMELQAPCVFALAMVIGAGWYFSSPTEPPASLIIVSTVIANGLLIGVRLRKFRRLGMIALLIWGGVSFGACSGSFATARGQHVQIEAPIGPVLLEGWIERAEPAKRGIRLVIWVHAMDRLPQSLTPHRVRLTHISSLKTEPGRFVRCWAVLRPPPAPVVAGDYAFDRHAWYAGLGGLGMCRADVEVGVWARHKVS